MRHEDRFAGLLGHGQPTLNFSGFSSIPAARKTRFCPLAIVPAADYALDMKSPQSDGEHIDFGFLSELVRNC